MNNRKELAELFRQFAENEDAYFEHSNPITLNGWKRTDGNPSVTSSIKDWRVVIPPKIKKIDLSMMVGSDIDMEFGKAHKVQYHINKLLRIDSYNKFLTVKGEVWDKCRIRQDHWHFRQDRWHYWNGISNCPLPEGLIVNFICREEGLATVHKHCDYKNWVWKDVPDDGDIIAFRVLGAAEGWEY